MNFDHYLRDKAAKYLQLANNLDSSINEEFSAERSTGTSY